MFRYAITRSNGNGTRIPTIGADEIIYFAVRYDEQKAEQFGKRLASYRQMIANNINENFALAEHRNFMLPLLMNGQVTVRADQPEKGDANGYNARKHQKN